MKGLQVKFHENFENDRKTTKDSQSSSLQKAREPNWRDELCESFL